MVSIRILKRILTIMLMGLACVAQNAVAQNLETAAQQARSALERGILEVLLMFGRCLTIHI